MLKKSFSKAKPVCKVTFSLPLEAAKGGKEVRLLGDFNEWSWEKGYKMKATKAEFTTEVELAAGKEYQFRYLIDNHIWENDWKADSYAPAAFGTYNSVLSLVEEKANGKAAAKNGNAKAAATTTATAKKTTVKAATTTTKKATTTAKAASDKAAPAAKSDAKPAAKATTTAKAASDKAAPAAKSDAKPAAKKAAAPKAAAKPAAKKAVATKVDLTKIEGIGPKIADLLKAAGIVTFDDLANAKVATLKGILEKAGKRFQMHDPATWTEQAKLAAKADWAKLDKMQAELKGGKR